MSQTASFLTTGVRYQAGGAAPNTIHHGDAGHHRDADHVELDLVTRERGVGVIKGKRT